jgi:hypothetical protein
MDRERRRGPAHDGQVDRRGIGRQKGADDVVWPVGGLVRRNLTVPDGSHSRKLFHPSEEPLPYGTGDDLRSFGP